MEITIEIASIQKKLDTLLEITIPKSFHQRSVEALNRIREGVEMLETLQKFTHDHKLTYQTIENTIIAVIKTLKG